MPNRLILNSGAFMLRDKDFGVAYEDFSMRDVSNGCVIEVRDPVLEGEAEAAAAEARSLQADLNVGPDSYFIVKAKTVQDARAGSEFSATTVDENDVGDRDADYDEALQKAALVWAKKMLKYGAANQTFRQKLWRFLDDPGSSRAAMMFTMCMLCLIIFSTVTFCLETLPQYYEHEPSSSSVWFIMEATCIAIFTAEFIGRISSTPDLRNYFGDTMNKVDVIAILPFYLEIALANVSIPGLSVFRVVRLVRVFRLFKVSRGSLTVFVSTMARSAKPLYMLIFFTTIAMIIFSSLMYYVERGVYNKDLKMWMRVYLYYCDVKVGASVGPAIKNPSNYTLDSGLVEPCTWVDPTTYDKNYINYPSEALFRCPFTYKKTSACTTVYEQSPYDSIPTSFWWCLVTMTTVGYGDVVPTQPLGKFLGGIVMIFGIVVIALPITVIGSNFATIYKKMVLDEEMTNEEQEDANDADEEEEFDDVDLDGDGGGAALSEPPTPS